MKRPLLLAILLFGCSCSYLKTESPSQLFERFSRRDKNASDKLEALAVTGDPDAQFYLGMTHELSAGWGNEPTPEELSLAMQWFRKAGEQGHALALFRLGLRYDYGRGVPKDTASALRFYQEAAANGGAYAMNRLGEMYYEGEGVSRDLATSYGWTLLASEKGDQDAQLRKGLIETFGTPGQLATGRKLRREWRSSHPEKRTIGGMIAVAAVHALRWFITVCLGWICANVAFGEQKVKRWFGYLMIPLLETYFISWLLGAFDEFYDPEDFLSTFGEIYVATLAGVLLWEIISHKKQAYAKAALREE